MNWPESFVDKVICGEGLEVMRRIPDACVDMILCDLPYGMTDNEWDCPISLLDLWAAYRRIAVEGAAIVLTGIQPYSSKLVCSNLEAFRYEWIWEKNKATGFLNAKRQPLRNHESVLVFSYGPAVYSPVMLNGYEPIHGAESRASSSCYGEHKGARTEPGATRRFPKSVLHFSVVNNDSPERLHPTQKPVALFEYLIRTYTEEGAIVLDNCLGSGTTARAAIRSGRRYIGIEISEEYCQLARKQIYEDQTQPLLL